MRVYKSTTESHVIWPTDKTNRWWYWKLCMYIICAYISIKGHTSRSAGCVWRTRYTHNTCTHSKIRPSNWLVVCLCRYIIHHKRYQKPYTYITSYRYIINNISRDNIEIQWIVYFLNVSRNGQAHDSIMHTFRVMHHCIMKYRMP